MGDVGQRAIRIASGCETREAFVVVFARFCSADALYVATRAPKPLGAVLEFAMTLKSGATMLEGRGRVTESHASKANPHGRPGMLVRIVQLSADSATVWKFLQDRRVALAARRGVPPPAAADDADQALRPEPTLVDEVLDDDEANELFGDTRVSGAPTVLPANPLGGLGDDSLAAFVECTVYEDSAAGAADAAPLDEGWDAVAPAAVAPPAVVPPTRAPGVVAPPAAAPAVVAPAVVAPPMAVTSRPASSPASDASRATIAKAVIPPPTPQAAIVASLASRPPAEPEPAPVAVAAPARVAAAPAAAEPAPPVPTPHPLELAADPDDGLAFARPRRGRTVAIGALGVVVGLGVGYLLGRARSGEPPAPATLAAAAPTPAPTPPPRSPTAAAEPSAPASTPAREAIAGCRIHITSAPDGADVAIDGQAHGAAPVDAALPCGAHELVVRRSRYVDQHRTVELAADAPGEVAITLARPQHEVRFASTPKGAIVTVDGAAIGSTPVVAKLKGFEHHSVVIEHPGFVAVHQSLYSTVAKDSVQVKLAKAASKGGKPPPAGRTSLGAGAGPRGTASR